VRALTLVALLATAAHAGPLTKDVEVAWPARHIPSDPPKPEGCEGEVKTYLASGGEKRADLPAVCLDWLYLRASEANKSRRALDDLWRWLDVHIPALEGQINARGYALRKARSSKAQDLFGTNLATNTGSLLIGGALGFNICSAN